MSDLTHSLSLEAWSTLSARDQEAAARVLSDALLGADRPLEVRGLRTLTPFLHDAGVEPEARTIATFFDTQHQLDWVLVPGGRVRAWGDRERRLLRTALAAMESFREERGEVLELGSIRPYDAPTFKFDSMFRSAAPVAPFLTTAMPLTSAVRLSGLGPGRSRLLPLTDGEASVFSVHDDELPQILEPRGWRLPSARESEWMCGAGGSLFPWGDEIPRWMSGVEGGAFDEEDFEEDDDGAGEGSFDEHFRMSYESGAADWSSANGFGLIDALVTSHWVLDGGLAWHGGAGECYPWQACGEWAGFITAAIVPEPTKPKAWSSHALRPVISLP